jgi:uncharacterized membrane protein
VAEKNGQPQSISALPPQVVSGLSARIVSYSHSGPIPPPEQLLEYESAFPGLGTKIIDLWEKQLEHRMKSESRVISSDVHRSWAGLGFGTLISIATMGVAALAIYMGQTIAGVVISSIDIAGIVGAFVYGTQQRRSEREVRVRALTGKKK